MKEMTNCLAGQLCNLLKRRYLKEGGEIFGESYFSC